MTLHTRLTELLGIEHPIISAPMAFAAGGKLAAIVTVAVGLGLIGGGYGDAEWLEREFAEARNTRVSAAALESVTSRSAWTISTPPGFWALI